MISSRPILTLEEGAIYGTNFTNHSFQYFYRQDKSN